MRRRGSILIAVLVLSTVALLVGGTANYILRNAIVISKNRLHFLYADQAARSGMEIALTKLTEGGNASSIFPITGEINNCTYTVTYNTVGNNTLEIISTAICPDGSRRQVIVNANVATSPSIHGNWIPFYFGDGVAMAVNGDPLIEEGDIFIGDYANTTVNSQTGDSAKQVLQDYNFRPVNNPPGFDTSVIPFTDVAAKVSEIGWHVGNALSAKRSEMEGRLHSFVTSFNNNMTEWVNEFNSNMTLWANTMRDSFNSTGENLENGRETLAQTLTARKNNVRNACLALEKPLPSESDCDYFYSSSQVDIYVYHNRIEVSGSFGSIVPTSASKFCSSGNMTVHLNKVDVNGVSYFAALTNAQTADVTFVSAGEMRVVFESLSTSSSPSVSRVDFAFRSVSGNVTFGGVDKLAFVTLSGTEYGIDLFADKSLNFEIGEVDFGNGTVNLYVYVRQKFKAPNGFIAENLKNGKLFAKAETFAVPKGINFFYLKNFTNSKVCMFGNLTGSFYVNSQRNQLVNENFNNTDFYWEGGIKVVPEGNNYYLFYAEEGSRQFVSENFTNSDSYFNVVGGINIVLHENRYGDYLFYVKDSQQFSAINLHNSTYYFNIDGDFNIECSNNRSSYYLFSVFGGVDNMTLNQFSAVNATNYYFNVNGNFNVNIDATLSNHVYVFAGRGSYMDNMTLNQFSAVNATNYYFNVNGNFNTNIDARSYVYTFQVSPSRSSNCTLSQFSSVDTENYYFSADEFSITAVSEGGSLYVFYESYGRSSNCTGMQFSAENAGSYFFDVGNFSINVDVENKNHDAYVFYLIGGLDASDVEGKQFSSENAQVYYFRINNKYSIRGNFNGGDGKVAVFYTSGGLSNSIAFAQFSSDNTEEYYFSVGNGFNINATSGESGILVFYMSEKSSQFSSMNGSIYYFDVKNGFNINAISEDGGIQVFVSELHSYCFSSLSSENYYFNVSGSFNINATSDGNNVDVRAFSLSRVSDQFSSVNGTNYYFNVDAFNVEANCDDGDDVIVFEINGGGSTNQFSAINAANYYFNVGSGVLVKLGDAKYNGFLQMGTRYSSAQFSSVNTNNAYFKVNGNFTVIGEVDSYFYAFEVVTYHADSVGEFSGNQLSSVNTTNFYFDVNGSLNIAVEGDGSAGAYIFYAGASNPTVARQMSSDRTVNYQFNLNGGLNFRVANAYSRIFYILGSYNYGGVVHQISSVSTDNYYFNLNRGVNFDILDDDAVGQMFVALGNLTSNQLSSENTTNYYLYIGGDFGVNATSDGIEVFDISIGGSNNTCRQISAVNTKNFFFKLDGNFDILAKSEGGAWIFYTRVGRDSDGKLFSSENTENYYAFVNGGLNVDVVTGDWYMESFLAEASHNSVVSQFTSENTTNYYFGLNGSFDVNVVAGQNGTDMFYERADLENTAATLNQFSSISSKTYIFDINGNFMVNLSTNKKRVEVFSIYPFTDDSGVIRANQFSSINSENVYLSINGNFSINATADSYLYVFSTRFDDLVNSTINQISSLNSKNYYFNVNGNLNVTVAADSEKVYILTPYTYRHSNTTVNQFSSINSENVYLSINGNFSINATADSYLYVFSIYDLFGDSENATQNQVFSSDTGSFNFYVNGDFCVNANGRSENIYALSVRIDDNVNFTASQFSSSGAGSYIFNVNGDFIVCATGDDKVYTFDTLITWDAKSYTVNRFAAADDSDNSSIDIEVGRLSIVENGEEKRMKISINDNNYTGGSYAFLAGESLGLDVGLTGDCIGSSLFFVSKGNASISFNSTLNGANLLLMAQDDISADLSSLNSYLSIFAAESNGNNSNVELNLFNTYPLSYSRLQQICNSARSKVKEIACTLVSLGSGNYTGGGGSGGGTSNGTGGANVSITRFIVR